MTERIAGNAAARLLDICRERGLRLATAESCTGGLVAAALTETAGASDVVDCGFVVYSNEAKQALLDVPEATLVRFGAVSAETAAAMARGALRRSRADLAVAITGIAGPGGGSPGKPVGLVHFAAAGSDGALLEQKIEFGAIGRSRVRQASVIEAIGLLQTLAQQRKRAT